MAQRAPAASKSRCDRRWSVMGACGFGVERQGRSTLRRRDAHELSPVERRVAGPQRTTVAPIFYGGQLSPPPCSLASEDYSQPAAADLARQCISPNARDGQFQSVGVRHFLICQFWPIDAGRKVGRPEKTMDMFKLFRLHCNRYGLLPMMFISKPSSRASIFLEVTPWLN